MLFSPRFLRYLSVVNRGIHAKQPTITDFQRKVYAATCRIPEGKVSTYKLLGQAIGCNCSRAIGQALKVNPFAPDVPCHRVVRTDLSLGGFAGHTRGPAWERKQELLAGEGVRMDSDGRIDPAHLFRFVGAIPSAEPREPRVGWDVAPGPRCSTSHSEKRQARR